jgi:hypothetical protein
LSECESFPGPAATNQQFNAFLRESGLRLVNVGEKKYVSLRSSAPATEDQVRFCVGYNAVIVSCCFSFFFCFKNKKNHNIIVKI